MSNTDKAGGPRLLICDDDIQIGRLIAEVATAIGYQVKTVTSIREFDATLDAWCPSCVVMDLLMPGADGVEGIKLLSNRKARPRLVLISGIGERVLESAGRAAQAYGLTDIAILPKPFRLDDVRAVLRSTVVEKAPHPRNVVPEGAERPIRASDLKDAIDNHRIHPVYQPKIDCRTQVVVGFEALARWRTADGRTIMPVDFIPLAASSGLIDALTDEIAQTGIRWLAESFPSSPMTLAINIVAQSLSAPALLERLALYCEQWLVPTQRIILELTEAGGVAEEPEILSELTRVRMMGFQFSIDDFGTGYSSMLELARLPFTELKIDQAFIRTLIESRESQAVVKLSVDLARNLGLTVVAEGVEEASLLDYVRDAGCHYAQGYHIARPMEGAQAVAWAWEKMRHPCPQGTPADAKKTP